MRSFTCQHKVSVFTCASTIVLEPQNKTEREKNTHCKFIFLLLAFENAEEFKNLLILIYNIVTHYFKL